MPTRRRIQQFVQSLLLIALLTYTSRAQAQAQTPPAPITNRLILISVDGLRPDLLLRAETPHMKALLARGAFTMWARSTVMSITLPTHVSMLTGVNPEAHGVMWNNTMPLSDETRPKYPTLLDEAHKAGLTVAMASGKAKFNIFSKPDLLVGEFVPKQDLDDDAIVAQHAVDIIKQKSPRFLFVHLPAVDKVGHALGWGSPQQLETIKAADAAIGTVLAALDHTGFANQTVIILTADHGGAGKWHGPEDARARHIPWIVAGPSIKKNYDLTQKRELQIDIIDTFSTACHLLGITPSKKVEGKPIMDILEPVTAAADVSVK